MCKSKNVRQVTERDKDNASFRGSVASTPSGEEQWTVHLDIKGTLMGFKKSSKAQSAAS